MRHYSLLFNAELVVLSGTSVIGRSPECQLILTGSDVSRLHAELRDGPDGVVVSDLGSFNGVYVNGTRIQGPTLLCDDDVITVGGHSLRFAAVAQEAPAVIRIPLAPGAEDEHDEGGLARETTKRADRWSLLSSAASALLDADQPARAERVLTSLLLGILEHASAHNADPARHATAAGLALHLAAATKKPRWVIYVLDLYTAIDQPLGVELVESLVTRAHEVVAEQPASAAQIAERLARYRELRQDDAAPAERDLLERLAASLR